MTSSQKTHKTKIMRKLPPCGFCRGEADHMSASGPAAFVPLCSGCASAAKEALGRKAGR